MRIWIAALVSAPLIALSHPVTAQPVPETAGETREAAIQSGDDWGSASTPFDRAGGAGRFDEQDPWQGFNRRIFGFNEFLDRYALKPAAKGYRWVTPGWLDDTVTRFFSNLGDIGDGLNYIFQWRWGEAGNSLGRFTINTTLGVAGLFDVASDVDLRNTNTSLDVTLGRWRGVAIASEAAPEKAEKLYSIFEEAVDAESYKKIEEQSGLQYRSELIGPEEFQEFLDNEVKVYTEVLKSLGQI